MSDADDELEARLTMSLLDQLVNGPAPVTWSGIIVTADSSVPLSYVYLLKAEGDDDGGIPE